MEDKLTYYDIVAHVVPGTLVLAVLALVPHALGFTVPWPKSELVGVALAIPLAYATGQVVQALSSFMQPVHYTLWGGQPSARIMEGKSGRLSGQRLERILDALSELFGAPADTKTQRESLFADAMALCNKNGLGRVDSFNAAYAFHRALLTAGVVATCIFGGALVLRWAGFVAAGQLDPPTVGYLLVVSLAGTVVEFIRARQRGEYFAVEVLNMAYLHARSAGMQHGG